MEEEDKTGLDPSVAREQEKAARETAVFGPRINGSTREKDRLAKQQKADPQAQVAPMHQQGQTPEQIARSTGMSLQAVKDLLIRSSE